MARNFSVQTFLKEKADVFKIDDYVQIWYIDFLREIANDIYKVVTIEKNRFRFQEQIVLFCKNNEKCQYEYSLFSRNKKPSDRTYDLLYYLTPPSDRILPSQADRFSRIFAKPVSKAQRLMASYAMLTAIHDSQIFENRINLDNLCLGDWDLKNDWLDILWNRCRFHKWRASDNELANLMADDKAWISRMFDEVNSDLENPSVQEPHHTRKLPKKRKTGRLPKYLDKDLERMLDMYESKYLEYGDSKMAWNCVAQFFGSASGEAARIACRQLRKVKK